MPPPTLYKNEPQPGGPETNSPTAAAGSPSGPLGAVAAALAGGRNADAVRLFLRTYNGALPGLAGSLVPMLRNALRREGLERLVRAFAAFDCFYCRGGFDPCARCGGSGRGERPGDACLNCMSLGVTLCDFCGGSGWVSYSFVPAALRPAVAAARTQAVLVTLAGPMGEPLPQAVARQRLRALRKKLARQVLDLGRGLAVLTNAVNVARRIRADQPGLKAFTAGLFARSSRTAKAVQRRTAAVFRLMAAASRHVASVWASDEDDCSFEEERAVLFDREAQRLEQAAARRTSLLRGR